MQLLAVPAPRRGWAGEQGQAASSSWRRSRASWIPFAGRSEIGVDLPLWLDPGVDVCCFCPLEL